MASRKAPAGAGSGLAAAGRERERERAHLELAELGPLLEEKGDQGPTGAASVRTSETPGREGIPSLAQCPRSVPADYPGNLPIIPLLARGVRLRVVPRAGPCSEPAQTLLPPSGVRAGIDLHRDATGIAVSVPGVSSASAFPQGRESPSRTLPQLRRGGAVPGPRAFPARSCLCSGVPAGAGVSWLGRAAVPASVAGMEIPAGNPAFPQDKSGISLPRVGQTAVCCINERDCRALPVPSKG